MGLVFIIWQSLRYSLSSVSPPCIKICVPIFYIFYAFLILLSNKNLMIFKILCDLILIFISFMISKIISTQDISNFKINSFVGSSLFLLLLSTPWGSNEYSELFCLFFIAPSIYLLLKKSDSKRNIFLSGLLFGKVKSHLSTYTMLCYFFLFAGLSAFMGGIDHGFFEPINQRYFPRTLTYLFVATATFFLFKYTVFTFFKGKVKRLLLILAYLQLIGFMISAFFYHNFIIKKLM